MTKFLIIDGNSFCCRAVYSAAGSGYGLSPEGEYLLTNHNGIPTGTYVVFFNMFFKLLALIRPTHIVFSWDTDKHTFRKELYPEYKAQRQSASKDRGVDMHIAHKQFKIIRKMMDMVGIKGVNLQGYEGDDICGSFANISKADKTYIVTSDMDSYQLVDDSRGIEIMRLKKGISEYDFVNEQYIIDKFGVDVNNYIALKTLKGDTSDNIKGLEGCGPKKAVQMIDDFGNLEKIASLRVDDLKSYSKTIKNNFDNWKERSSLIKKLVTIVTDLELPYTYDDCEIDVLNWDNLIPYLEDLDMKRTIIDIKCGAAYKGY